MSYAHAGSLLLCAIAHQAGTTHKLFQTHFLLLAARAAPESCMNLGALNQRGREECRALDAPAASRAK